MERDTLFVFLVIGVAAALFASGRVRLDIVALGVVIVLAVSGASRSPSRSMPLSPKAMTALPVEVACMAQRVPTLPPAASRCPTLISSRISTLGASPRARASSQKRMKRPGSRR